MTYPSRHLHWSERDNDIKTAFFTCHLQLTSLSSRSGAVYTKKEAESRSSEIMKTFVVLCVSLCLMISAVYSVEIARSGGGVKIIKRGVASDIVKSRVKRSCPNPRRLVFCICRYFIRKGNKLYYRRFYIRARCCGWFFYPRPRICCRVACRRYIIKHIG